MAELCPAIVSIWELTGREIEPDHGICVLFFQIYVLHVLEYVPKTA
jgi:hypothetical protein